MAHFAEIDGNNKVLRVLVVSNDHEHRGQEFLAEDLGLGGTWIQTSYNSNIRKQFAGKDFVYDQIKDIFIRPQPFESWTLDENHDWQPPTPRPDGDFYWDEDTQTWQELEEVS